LIRQTPNSIGTWDNCIFYLNQDVKECDYWVVYDNLIKIEKTKCPKRNVILITGEPPTIKKYSQTFVKQFYNVITCNRNIIHANVTYIQQGLPWMVGAKFLRNEKKWDNINFKSYDDFINNDYSKKTKEISIVVSNKTFTKGHEQRVKFVNKLKEIFGDRIDIFGRGFNEIEDKFEAISLYKYTIVIENSSYCDYWTEKIADAFLCGTYPIYYGCTNIYEYFPKGSLALIDINNIEESVNIINSILNSNEFENSLNLIQESKNLILNRYNLFPLIVNTIKKMENIHSESVKVTLYPEKRFQKKIKFIIKKVLKKII